MQGEVITDHFACAENRDSGEKPGCATGPRTPEGKARSSMNRLCHGLRSEQTILRDEDPEEFEFTIQAWFDHYLPGDDDMAQLLVQETALAHWFFKRSRKRLEEIEWNLPGNAWNWTDEHQKLFAKFTRYKTTAERAFMRWYKELERHCEREQRREHPDRRAFDRLAAIEKRWTAAKRQTAPAAHTVEQFVEVGIVGGKAHTTCCPSNDDLLRQTAGLPEPPAGVTRWVEFHNGVPAEYAWASPAPVDARAVKAVQQLSFADWLHAVEREKLTPHLAAVAEIRFLEECDPVSPEALPGYSHQSKSSKRPATNTQ